MFRSVCSLSLCRSVYCLCVNVHCNPATGCQPVYCLCVNVHCNPATGCQPSCSQIYHIYLFTISNGHLQGELYKVKKDVLMGFTVSFVNSVWSSWGLPFRGWNMGSSKQISTIFYRLLLNWGSLRRQLGTLPEDGNVMPKHVGASIHN
jgi:hypothetical protein